MSSGCGGHCESCCGKGYQPREAASVARDPVCGKKLDCESYGVRKLKWDDSVFFFCGTACMTKFIDDPKRYLKKKGFFSFLRRS